MTHVVELEIRRFYRVYVEDPAGNMSTEELTEAAKRMAVEDWHNAELDSELTGIEEGDILSAHYEYELPDVFDDGEAETKGTGPYRYYMPYRPPMPGAMPKDGIVRMFAQESRAKMEGCNRPVWGWVEYDRKLTAKEISDYELIEGEE